MCKLIVIYFEYLCQSILDTERKVIQMKNDPLIIKRRGEDGNRVITVRIREEILAKLDKLSAETNHSRNELINLILAHGLENIEIQ